MKKLLILSLCACAFAGCKHDTVVTDTSTATPTTTGSPENAGNPNPGGKLKDLIIKDVKVGKGNAFKDSARPVANGDTVYVTYKGKLADGTVFDTNQDSDKPAFSFVVGEGSVIPGWDRGLLGMVTGGERNLSVPSSLGYGEAGHPPAIGPNADLFFNIKLLDVVKKGEDVDIYKLDKKVGSGTPVRDGAKVTLLYSVQDVAGKMVDNNGGKPVTFTMGGSQARQAIETGMLGPPAMRVGGIRLLHIGPQFALEGKGTMRGPQVVTIQLVKVG